MIPMSVLALVGIPQSGFSTRVFSCPYFQSSCLPSGTHATLGELGSSDDVRLAPFRDFER